MKALIIIAIALLLFISKTANCFPNVTNNIDFLRPMTTIYAIGVKFDDYERIIYEGPITLINNSTFMVDDLELVFETNSTDNTNTTYLIKNHVNEKSTIHKLSQKQYDIFNFYFVIAYYHDKLKLFYYNGNSAVCSYRNEELSIIYKHVTPDQDELQDFKLFKLKAFLEQDFHDYNKIMNTHHYCVREYEKLDF